ncbi:MAG: protein kinase [Sandaracinaceae bacterium]|nr:protein kinase [Sandaracinaceae bacterium]
MPSTASELGTIPAKQAHASGVFQTSPGMLRKRVLGPWAEGIQQYLAIRLGDGARGRAAYRTLARMVESLPIEELLEDPGPKAQLYRLARSVAETERAMPGGASEGSLKWRTAGRRGYARLRSELSPRDAEILELRHARELELEELAFVLELGTPEAELRLDTAEARARQILGRDAPDPLDSRAAPYVEAFALARSWNAEGEEAETEGLEPGTLVGGRYQLVQRVGVGAFGDVYRAEDVEVPGHQVALKMLRQPALSTSARQSALRELKLNAAVFHPSLVQFKDHGWFDERLWFVMPWYEGETLEQRMRREPLTRAEARAIFVPLARALGALHAVGIRHQDIKPENVLLTRLPGEEGILPVLIDLGVAAEECETMLGGTPLYFAPEVAARFTSNGAFGPDVGPAADVFALALSLRNALEPDTQADVPAGAVRAFVARRAEEIPDLPDERDLRFLGPHLLRWMSHDPLDRPTAVELAEELAVLTAPEERRERRWRLFRWLAPLLFTLAVGFGAVVWAMQQQVAEGQHAARSARAAAAEARADLIVAGARQEALQEGHAALLQRYEQSRLSRSELAGELATTEGQLGIVRQELSAAIAQRRATREELLTTRGTLAEREATLAARDATVARLETDLEDARARSERVERDLVATLERASGAERARDAARAHAAALGQEIESANARATAAETQLSAARAARDSAVGELAGLRARVASLANALSATPETISAPPSEEPQTPTIMEDAVPVE